MVCIFTTRRTKGCAKSAPSPEGATANTKSWSGPAVDGVRAAHAASRLKTEEENDDGKDDNKEHDNKDNVVEDEDDEEDHQQHHDDQEEHGDDDEAPGSATEAAPGVGELHIIMHQEDFGSCDKSLGIREIGRGGCGRARSVKERFWDAPVCAIEALFLA